MKKVFFAFVAVATLALASCNNQPAEETAAPATEETAAPAVEETAAPVDTTAAAAPVDTTAAAPAAH